MPRKILKRVVEFGLLALIFLRPFVSGIVHPRSNLFVQALILFLAILGAVFFIIHKEKFRLLSTPLSLPFLFFCLIGFLSALFSPYPGESLPALSQLVGYLLFYFLAVHYLSWSRISRPLVIFLVAGFLLSLYAFYQYRFALPSLGQRLGTITTLGPGEMGEIRARIASRRVFATFPLPSSFAGYLALVIPLGIGLFIARSSFRERVLLGMVTLTMLWALFLTFSWGGILSLILALLSIIFILSNKRKWFIPVILIFLLLLGIVHFRSEGLHSKVTFRLYNWRSALEMVKDRPLLGTGIGTFGTAYPGYKLPGANQVWYAHNWYLQVASEMGILGLGALLWLVVTFVKQGIKSLRSEKEKSQRALLAGLLTGGFAFLLHNLFDMDAYVPEIALLWWTVAGLIMLKCQSNAKDSMNPPGVSKGKWESGKVGK